MPALVDATPVRWADLRLRVISALVLAPIAIGCVWLGGWAWAALVGAAGTGIAAEWVLLWGVVERWRAALVAGPVLGAAVAAAFGLPILALAILAAGWLVASRLSRLTVGAGVVYAGLATVALIWLRGDTAAMRNLVLLLVLIVWASDVAAYAAGRFFGGPKLAPHISPGKTWAGAIAGVVAAIIVGLVVHASLLGVAAAAGLAAVAQAGDLFESWIKRRAGVKDSSQLIPGHGGLMDRLDGFLTAAPVMALLFAWAGQ